MVFFKDSYKGRECEFLRRKETNLQSGKDNMGIYAALLNLPALNILSFHSSTVFHEVGIIIPI